MTLPFPLSASYSVVGGDMRRALVSLLLLFLAVTLYKKFHHQIKREAILASLKLSMVHSAFISTHKWDKPPTPLS